MKKILLSGIQPSGKLHIGNYFGAMKQFVDLQDDYKAYIFIANYHALTTNQEGNKLSKQTMDVAMDYLAIGLDPAKTTLFIQSDVPEVTELAWIFETLTTVPYLMRAHAFKDADQKTKEVNVGLFNYPMLMAADILIQDTDMVPVGQDQKQHVEYARDTAEKFNRTYGDTFKLPEPMILQNVAVVPGTDGRKMSKSYGNTIPLFAEKNEITEAVMSIKTDSKGVNEPKDPEADLVFAMHRLVSGGILDELEKRYRGGEIGYKESKEILIDNMEKFIGPMRERRKDIEGNPDDVRKIIKDGGLAAGERARTKMVEVRKKAGLSI